MCPLTLEQIAEYLTANQRGYRIILWTYHRGKRKNKLLARMPCEHPDCLQHRVEKILDKFYKGISEKTHTFFDYSSVRAALCGLTASYFDKDKYQNGITYFCRNRRTTNLVGEDTIVGDALSGLDMACSNETCEIILIELCSIRGWTSLHLFSNGWSYKAIALKRKITTSAVGTNIFRVRKKLILRLVALGIIPPPSDR